ncbi:protein of unknown function [Shewanella benthica]|uniref:Uncharacterized protein n=1 Tax=Shewanella benthica TaxID=43661 RepID=A0A330M4Q5_9GAMM|nr:protein of unknown function [Shewanella benthica]
MKLKIGASFGQGSIVEASWGRIIDDLSDICIALSHPQTKCR